jgi:hypothetical protein
MIWLWVASPKDFVAIGNRFAFYYQRVTPRSNDCFVANLSHNLMVLKRNRACLCRFLLHLTNWWEHTWEEASGSTYERFLIKLKELGGVAR